jgi:hypothetical protein
VMQVSCRPPNSVAPTPCPTAASVAVAEVAAPIPTDTRPAQLTDDHVPGGPTQQPTQRTNTPRKVRHRETGSVYAVKSMRKAHVVDMNDVHGVRTERSVMMRIRHPFVIRVRAPPPPPRRRRHRRRHRMHCPVHCRPLRVQRLSRQPCFPACPRPQARVAPRAAALGVPLGGEAVPPAEHSCHAQSSGLTEIYLRVCEPAR